MSRKIKMIGTISLLTLMFISITCIGMAPMTANAIGTITYMGVTRDVTNFQTLNYGSYWWFAQLGRTSPVTNRYTDENDNTNRPSWTKDLVHWPNDWDFFNRTFSQDGPTRTKGGYPGWATITLPNGSVKISGCCYDPYTIGNSNNTVNKIRLDSAVPSTFYFHIVVDNTAQAHKQTMIRARGDHSGTSIEPNTYPSGAALTYNGIPDVYTFKYTGFVDGDYQKVQFSAAAGSDGSGFAGWIWGTSFTPAPSFEPAG